MSKSKPIITRLLLVKDKSIFLMLRNGKGSDFGAHKRWIAPGGALDEGESVKECLLRETKEEIGLDLDESKLTLVLEKYDPIFDVDMFFYSYPYNSKDKIQVLEPKKFDKVEWVKVEEISELAGKNEHIGVYIEEAAALAVPVQKTSNIYKRWAK